MSERTHDPLAANYFDRVEVHTDVAVQVLMNTLTGRTSIIWSRDPGVIEEWLEENHAHSINGEEQ